MLNRHPTLNIFLRSVNENDIGNSDGFLSDERPLERILGVKWKPDKDVFYRGKRKISNDRQKRLHPAQTTEVCFFNLQSTWNNHAIDGSTTSEIPSTFLDHSNSIRLTPQPGISDGSQRIG